MKKEEIYIDLQGKSKEELTAIQNVLISFKEPTFRDDFKSLYKDVSNIYLFFDGDEWITDDETYNKQEVTIQQLKEILQPMEGFRPIAMKCTREQFEAIKPKLKEIGKIWQLVGAFTKYEYLTNNYDDKLTFDFVKKNNDFFDEHKGNIHEEWNEEIFLKACGVEVETLEQQLEKAKAEVKRIEKEIEDSKIKIGDWVISSLNDCIFRYQYGRLEDDLTKITDQELINKLNNLIK